MAGEVVAGQVLAAQFCTNALEERIDCDKECLRRQAIPARVPHPLVAHGADAALELAYGGDAAERGGDHVAMLQSRDESGSLVRVVPQPVEQLGETPLR